LTSSFPGILQLPYILLGELHLPAVVAEEGAIDPMARAVVAGHVGIPNGIHRVDVDEAAGVCRKWPIILKALR
jgi:hypothetical protein